jgi:hypothetical protein
VGAVAEGTVLAVATAAERDGRLAGEVPLVTVGVGEDDGAFDAQGAIGANGDLHSIRH